MKKIILTALVAASSLCASAQVWLGGSVGFDVTSPKVGDSNTTFTIAPTIGYSLDENWDLALELEYANYGDVANAEAKDAFVISPFARYNFAKCGIATFFIDGGFGFGKVSYEGNYDDATLFNIGVRPGVKVELSPKVELDAKLGYLGYHNVKDLYSKFGLSANGEALSFGLTFKF
ncbi:MAG: outer membrane beta-barrel protein [Bacteroidaceae bacterium]|nr:outer membrane beta-barrel protein [Bacteroidaceae bacterium]